MRAHAALIDQCITSSACVRRPGRSNSVEPAHFEQCTRSIQLRAASSGQSNVHGPFECNLSNAQNIPTYSCSRLELSQCKRASPLAGQHAGVVLGDALVLAEEVANLARACVLWVNKRWAKAVS